MKSTTLIVTGEERVAHIISFQKEINGICQNSRKETGRNRYWSTIYTYYSDTGELLGEFKYRLTHEGKYKVKMGINSKKTTFQKFLDQSWL